MLINEWTIPFVFSVAVAKKNIFRALRTYKTLSGNSVGVSFAENVDVKNI